MFQLRLKKQLSGLCSHNRFLSLFALNQRYGFLRCMKLLATIRIKMVVSVVQSIGIFSSSKVKKWVASVVSALSRGFLVLKHVLKTVSDIEWIEYG